MQNHPPPDQMLADYAAGVTSPGVSLLVAAHLTHAPASRDRVRTFEAMGGALLAEETKASMPSDALDAVMARLDAAPEIVPERTVPEHTGPLPRPVIDRMGVGFDRIPWRFRLPGVAEYVLDGFEDEHVSLLRARPGAKVPQHTHEAPELTLVLAGCLSDGGELYGTGDVALNDEEDDHRPQAVGDETCYCLIVRQGDLRFTGRFSRLLNYLGE